MTLQETPNRVPTNTQIKNEKDNQEIITSINSSPTADDTVLNRYSVFLLYCVAEFNQRACLVLLVSTDKSHAKMGKFSKYLNKVVDSSTTAGIAATGVGIPIAKGAGKITGELVEGLINEYKKPTCICKVWANSIRFDSLGEIFKIHPGTNWCQV